MPASVPVQYGHGGSLSHACNKRSSNRAEVARHFRLRRLSSAIDADLVCALKGGRVLGQETHSESMWEKGLYASLCAKQFKDFS